MSREFGAIAMCWRVARGGVRDGPCVALGNVMSNSAATHALLRVRARALMDPPLRYRNLPRRLGVVRLAAILGMLAVVAAGVAVYRLFQAEMQAARVKLLAGSRVLSTACGPIEVAEEGDGPPVLVVHGTGGGYDQGLNFLRRSVGEGFHRIAISRFGYLRTPQPSDMSSAAQAESFVCALDAVGSSRVAVVGLSGRRWRQVHGGWSRCGRQTDTC